MDDAPLTPAQQAVVDDLMARRVPRPTFPEELGLRLRSELETALAPLADRIAARGDEPLHVAKHALDAVHQCERRHLADDALGFSWSVATVKGTVLHKAIELSVTNREPVVPATLVDRAIERFVEDDSGWGPGPFLDGAPAEDIAELRAEVTDLFTKFQDTFPPIKADWRPRIESAYRIPLCADRIVLRGRADLCLGQPRGTQARVLIVDFKSGAPYPSHVDELRYYALLETLRCGVPPFRVATYYLDGGRWHGEDVSTDVLDLTVRRVVDGARKLVELQVDGRSATYNAGPQCGYCVIADDCPGSAQWREEREALGVG